MRVIFPPRRAKVGVEKIRDDATGGPRQAVPGGAPGTSHSGQDRRNAITFERVDAAIGNGKFLVAGKMLTTTGDGRGLKLGEVVPVAWKNGEPVVIISHHVSGGEFSMLGPLKAGIVEELFVATNAKGEDDVYFRNVEQITALNVKKHTGGVEPGFVLWGTNDDAFVVRDKGSQTRFHVFKLNRQLSAGGILSAHKVYGGRKARIKAKLYTVDLNDVTYPLSAVTFKYHRDSGRPFIQGAAHLVDNHRHTVGDFCLDITTNFMHWANDGVTLARHADTMQMLRTITVTLQGLTTQYAESVAGTRMGTVTATVENVFLDKDNELLIAFAVEFASFGAKTTVDGLTYPGITGGIVGESENASTSDGNGTICPFVSTTGDPDPTFGPGVNIFNVTEKHAHVVKARTGAVVFSTLLPTATRTVEHTKNARWNFVADDLHHNIGAVQMTLGNYVTFQNQSEFAEDGGAIPGPICVEQAHQFGNYFFGQIAGCPTPGGFFIQIDEPPPGGEVQHIEPFDDVVCEVFDAGDVGNEGIVTLEQDLLNGTLSSLLTTPRQVSPQNDWTGFLSVQGVPGDNGNTVPDHVGFQAAYHRDNFAVCSAGEQANAVHYDYTGKFVLATVTPTFHTIDKVRTYEAEFRSTPFAMTEGGGEFFQLVVLVDRALRPTTWNDGLTPLAGHASDPSYLTVVVVRDGAVYTTLIDKEVVPQGFDASVIKVMTGGVRDLLWRRDKKFFLTVLLTGQTVEVGADADAAKADGLRFSRPPRLGADFNLLYGTPEPERYFVTFKTRAGTLTLKQSDKNFPPRDARFFDLGDLLNLQGVKDLKRKEVQVVLDDTVAPVLRTAF